MSGLAHRFTRLPVVLVTASTITILFAANSGEGGGESGRSNGFPPIVYTPTSLGEGRGEVGLLTFAGSVDLVDEGGSCGDAFTFTLDEV
jgi:hypothetical protein